LNPIPTPETEARVALTDADREPDRHEIRPSPTPDPALLLYHGGKTGILDGQIIQRYINQSADEAAMQRLIDRLIDEAGGETLPRWPDPVRPATTIETSPR
jgi:hypothetical protein